MQLHDFENLWVRREELAPEQREELERFAREDRHARAFVQGGGSVRRLLMGTEGQRAAEGFAYRMRVYAANHRDENAPYPAFRGAWLRWPAMTMGLVAGAMMVLFAFGPMFNNGGSDQLPEMAREQVVPDVAMPDQGQRAVPEATVSDENLAQETDSLAMPENTERRGPQDERSMPDWDLHTVSTSGE